jgi:hypothetical protein
VDEFLAEVHVDELADFEEADGGAAVAAADVDGESLVADDPVRPDFAGDGVGRVRRGLLALGGRKLVEGRAGRPSGQIALGGSLVADPLVGALLVVVGAEAVEQEL